MTIGSQLTFVIIAQDESAHITECINSSRLPGVRHLVVDGGSRDLTVPLAIQAGAVVIKKPYVNSTDQYNFAIEAAETPWVFILDADERLDRELYEALLNVDYDNASLAGYRCARENYFMGRLVRHGGWYPDYNIRLLRVGHASYEQRPVHARVLVSGSVGTLNGALLHLTYESISQYIRKLDRYTSLEVDARQSRHVARGGRAEAKAIVRQWLLRVPLAPVMRFLWTYVARRGFLDGRTGFDIAVLASFYEYMIGVKVRYAESGTPVSSPRTPLR